MERLWIREVRRAARRASAPFARQIALGCGAAAVGTMAASLLPLQLDGSAAQAAWAAVWAVAGYSQSGPGSSLVICGGIDLADFGTTTGLRDRCLRSGRCSFPGARAQVRRQPESRR